VWPADDRFKHIFAKADQYQFDRVLLHIPSYDAEYAHDKIFLKKEMGDRGIPILELDVEYGDGPSGQLTTRFEAFPEMLQNRMQEPVASH
jgi:benzoyl-CoA reductase/2-hydroxyglutaryl-CoA dehydratase subunit BcrC/BadD/HgdB